MISVSEGLEMERSWEPISSKTKDMNFGEAVKAMDAGKKVWRSSWPQGYWLRKMDGQLQGREGTLCSEDCENLVRNGVFATDWEVVCDVVDKAKLDWLKDLISKVITPNYIVPELIQVWDQALRDLWKLASGKEYHKKLEVHDIGWAVRQLKAGKAIRRKQWYEMFRIVMPNSVDRIKLFEGLHATEKRYDILLEELLATDWELYEEPKKTVVKSGEIDSTGGSSVEVGAGGGLSQYVDGGCGIQV